MATAFSLPMCIYLPMRFLIIRGVLRIFFLPSQKPGVRCPAGSVAGTFSVLPSRGVPRLAKTGFPKSCYVPILYFKRLFFKGKLTKFLKPWCFLKAASCIPYCIKFSWELIFAISAIVLKSAVISSRKFFSKKKLSQNGTTTNMMEMF